ncbi:UNVERIFIED_CONTAM: hypothetical protein HDU68_001706 [Siphonaria sp. JEL0065]|nr:hypothetical protein HDU68_001706 [Siphonaria sp. JEL0065]
MKAASLLSRMKRVFSTDKRCETSETALKRDEDKSSLVNQDTLLQQKVGMQRKRGLFGSWKRPATSVVKEMTDINKTEESSDPVAKVPDRDVKLELFNETINNSEKDETTETDQETRTSSTLNGFNGAVTEKVVSSESESESDSSQEEKEDGGSEDDSDDTIHLSDLKFKPTTTTPQPLNTTVKDWMDKQPSVNNSKKYNRASKAMMMPLLDVEPTARPLTRRVPVQPQAPHSQPKRQMQTIQELLSEDDQPLGQHAKFTAPSVVQKKPTKKGKKAKKQLRAPSKLSIDSTSAMMNPMLMYQMQMMQQFQMLEIQQKQIQLQQQQLTQQHQQSRVEKKKTLVNFSASEMESTPTFKLATAHTSAVRQRALEKEILRMRGEIRDS